MTYWNIKLDCDSDDCMSFQQAISVISRLPSSVNVKICFSELSLSFIVKSVSECDTITVGCVGASLVSTGCKIRTYIGWPFAELFSIIHKCFVIKYFSIRYKSEILTRS